jgi:hypothetical protein
MSPSQGKVGLPQAMNIVNKVDYMQLPQAMNIVNKVDYMQLPQERKAMYGVDFVGHRKIDQRISCTTFNNVLRI